MKLSGLDSEILEYIVTVLQESADSFGDKEQFDYYTDMVANFLTSSSFSSTEEDAAKLSKELLMMIRVNSSAPALPPPSVASPVLPIPHVPASTSIAIDDRPVPGAAKDVGKEGGKKAAKETVPKKVKEPKEAVALNARNNSSRYTPTHTRLKY